MSDVFHAVASTTASLAVVLALVLVAARSLRSMGFVRGIPKVVRGHHRLALQDSVAVDRVRRLHVIRCDGRDLLLLTGSTSEVVVGWLPAPTDPTGGNA